LNTPSIFTRYRAEIDAELREVLVEYRSPMYKMLQYQLGWVDETGCARPGNAGKALRPTLCLLASEALGDDYRKALPAAAALELLHNFSLIHDDVQDDDRERRHRPTVWAIWGKPQAINAGTAMRIIANRALMRLHDHAVSVEKQIRAQRLLDETTLRLIEGQFLDISFEMRHDVVITDYMDMIAGKTAALIACSLECGALLNTDDDCVIRSFRDFGRNLGFAFQIRDDVLGIWGDEARTGKPVGSDIRRRKKSLPIVYAWNTVNGTAKSELVRIYASGVIDDGGRDTVLDILDGVQAQAYAQSLVERYCDRAAAELETMALSVWARDNLEEMAHFLTRRDF
jgi:geranylgeranyl diphosphate synthase type I